MNNLRAIRTAKGLSQRQFSELCHTCQALVCDIEREQKATWPKFTATACKVLEKTPKEIFPELNEQTLAKTFMYMRELI